jgi:hypothetical protein
MENQDKLEEKKSNRKIIWITIVISIIVYSVMGLIIFTSKEDLKNANSKLLNEQSLNSTCSYKRDSLTTEVKQLSIYKSLTKAMVHRDEATSLLKYKVGDFVYMKRDSTHVVISDIVIGGSKYEYYIKYKVLHKDNSTEEIIPELIY